MRVGGLHKKKKKMFYGKIKSQNWYLGSQQDAWGLKVVFKNKNKNK